ncbi:unnamed protein product [Fusarium venenatum]|uniref:Uncharacterized protein n=1 Tax=Fusarium venenatum TaxID=56646 RepID=A0A2L2TFU7_9HYPO|nr:uncharacterized protein FVRRES_11898 [Fusarium venenatum]CEI39207.1 unnamed protein product [Fusarium venenatum]
MGISDKGTLHWNCICTKAAENEWENALSRLGGQVVFCVQPSHNSLRVAGDSLDLFSVEEYVDVHRQLSWVRLPSPPAKAVDVGFLLCHSHSGDT